MREEKKKKRGLKTLEEFGTIQGNNKEKEEVMGTITKYPFDLKDKEGWLKIRTDLAKQGRLGGSDIGSAVGDNPYKSPYALWCEMIGLYTPEDISEKEAIKQGVMFEAAVADRFAKESGIQVEEVPYIFTNSDAPHLFATPDRLCLDGESGLECKTAKEIVMKKFPQGDFPQQYFDQCCCYLKVTERKRWYIAILVYGTAFNIYMMTTIKEEADRYNQLKAKVDNGVVLTPGESKEWQEKWNWLVAAYYIDQETLDSVEIAADNFISRVNAGMQGNLDVWPVEEIDGSESTKKVLAKVNPVPLPNSVVTFDSSDDYGLVEGGENYVDAKGSEVCALVSQRMEYDETIKALMAEKSTIDNKLAAMMKDKEKFVVPGCSVTYKVVAGRETASVSAIKAYFDRKGEKVPEGLISKAEDSRGIRFYPEKKKKK